MDPVVCVAGFFVGTIVGLTGMGGGALMTPILVLLFGVQPLAAVSSDLVASMIMKPFGGFVHWRHGTVHKRLVLFLMLGSIPSAFAGVLILRSLGSGERLQQIVKTGLGVALLVVAACLIVRPLLTRRRATYEDVATTLKVHVFPTVVIGIVGGLVVGMTSVGSGSLMIMMLLLLYPRMRLSQLVGTDLVQAIPLVASAAIAHLIFGELKVGLTASIVIGSVPGVLVGAHFSSRAPDHLIRGALLVVLTVSALKLLGVSNGNVGMVAPVLIGAALAYMVLAGRAAARRRTVPRPTIASVSAPIGESHV